MDNKDAILLEKDALLHEFRSRFGQLQDSLHFLIEASDILYQEYDKNMFSALYEKSKGIGCVGLAHCIINKPETKEKVNMIFKESEKLEYWNEFDWGSFNESQWQNYILNGDKLLAIRQSLNLDQQEYPKEYLVFLMEQLPKAYEIEFRSSILKAIAAQFSLVRRVKLIEEDNHRQTLKALTKALDARDNYTRGHSDRVALYARAMGEVLYDDYCDRLYPETHGEVKKHPKTDFMTRCYLSGLLHDIGKIAMEDFLKGESAPTDAQWLQLTCHVREGARILSEVGKYKSWGLDRIALHHHESFNGQGYLRKKKEELSIFEKIVAIADSFDAMTSDRAYRVRMAWDMALDDLRVNSLLAKKDDDKVYDPAIFRVFEMAICRNNDVFLKNKTDQEKQKLKLLEEASNQLKDISPDMDQLDKYKMRIDDIRYFDERYPGNCKIKLQKRMEEDKDRFENNEVRCFSFAFLKLKDGCDEQYVVENLKELNKVIKNRGQKYYQISGYKDVFVVYSLTQPDREIYELLHSLPKQIRDNMKAVVSRLQKGKKNRFELCHGCLADLVVGENPTIRFYRDIHG